MLVGALQIHDRSRQLRLWLAARPVFERGQCCCEFVNSIKYTFAHIFSKVIFSVYELIKLMSFSRYMFFWLEIIVMDA